MAGRRIKLHLRHNNNKLPDKKLSYKHLSRQGFTRSLLIFMTTVSIAVLSAGCADRGSDNNIIINEIVSKNNKSLNGLFSGSPDWIELYNPSGKDISLSGYKICDNSHAYTFGDKVIKAGGYLVVCADAKDTSGEYINFGISSEGEALYLADTGNCVIDRVWVPRLSGDESYARRSDGVYGYCKTTTPGEKNDDGNILTQDELIAETEASDIIISEVLPRGTEGQCWVELYNAGETAVNLESFCLSNSEADPSKWRISKNTLEAGKYAVIYIGSGEQGEGVLNAPFTLGGNDTGVFLHDVTGTLKSSLKWESGLPRGASVIAEGGYTVFPTAGAANSARTLSSTVMSDMDSSDPVRINEVLARNVYGIQDSKGNRSGWAEICNESPNAVSLSGYFLSDDEENLFKWAFPDIRIESGSYLTVFFSGETGEQLHASFKLSGKETNIYLTDIDEMKVDSFSMPGEAYDDVSTGRGVNGGIQYFSYPTPGEKNSGGSPLPSQRRYPDNNGIHISEVCAAAKAKSGGNDWIEIHNGSTTDMDLKGCYLSDDKNEIEKWQFPPINVGAGGYVVIEASSAAAKGSDIACFGVSSGETLLLSDPRGGVVDVFETGTLTYGITSGRSENRAAPERVFFTTATRGSANSVEYKTGYTAVPEFSETGLYHSSALNLSIRCATPGAVVHYTTDGSIPTSYSKVYSKPITIKKNAVIRAAAYAEGLLGSEIKTSTFIFDAPHALPVVCLTGKPGEMKKLLHITHKSYSHKPEYKANVEYYEKDGTLGVTFESGLRPKGNYSMNYPQKSFVISLRGSYGRNEVTYPFFEGSSVTSFSALCLRSSGQDFKFARMRDSYFQRVADGLNLETIDNRPVVVYINGEYYGLYDLNEEQNESYINSYFGTDEGKIDIIKRDGSALSGDNHEFLRIQNMAKNSDLSDDKVFAEFCKYIDIDAFTDFLVMQIYFASGDVSNLNYWRAQDYSIKWRPMLHDLDWAMLFAEGKGNAFGNYFSWHETSARGAVTKTYITSALKENKGWRDKFVERFVELAETKFSNERILPIYDALAKEMAPEMPLHIKKYHAPRNMEYWSKRITQLRGEIERRKPIAYSQLQHSFNVSDEKLKELIAKYSAGQQALPVGKKRS